MKMCPCVQSISGRRKSGVQPVRDGVVLVEAGKLAYVGLAADAPHEPESVERIDARGGTIMPGLVEAHFHATYFNIAALEDLDIKHPVEYVSLLASVNSKLALAASGSLMCMALS